MSSGGFIPGCYDQYGNPVPLPSNPNDIIKPLVPEGKWMPSPQQAAKNVATAIANLVNTPQPSLE